MELQSSLVLHRKVAAHRLGISVRSLDRLIAGGQIRAARPSAKRVVIPTSEIDRILNGTDKKVA